MVYKITKGKYRVFVEAFLLTIIILIIGFSIGFYFEYFRTSSVVNNYNSNEIQALDLKLQNYYYQIMNQSSCKSAIEQNFIFADKLYLEGLQIERYEEANQITSSLLVQKKRYVLLKTELWLNSIILKNKCGKPFDTLVYFYSSDPKNNLKVAEQQAVSNVLKTIKEDKGNTVILLPIAGDLNLETVDLLERAYNITEFPAVLINEKTVLYGFHSESEIKKYLKS